MAFKSAELKTLYEELRAQGRPLPASEVASLFRKDQLKGLAAAARWRGQQIKVLTATVRAVERLMKDVKPGVWLYLAYEVQLEDLKARLHELAPYMDERERW